VFNSINDLERRRAGLDVDGAAAADGIQGEAVKMSGVIALFMLVELTVGLAAILYGLTARDPHARVLAPVGVLFVIASAGYFVTTSHVVSELLWMPLAGAAAVIALFWEIRLIRRRSRR
jgi:hypothetical protein